MAHADAESLFSTVFTTGDPLKYPFQPQVERACVVAPVLGKFEAEQLEALLTAGADTGPEPSFLVAGTADRGDDVFWPDRPLLNVTRISSDEPEGYFEVPEVEAEAICSTRGTWGALLSSVDWYAIIGGSDAFVNKLLETYPPFPIDPGVANQVPADKQVDYFVKEVKTWKEKDWARRLLFRVYGPEVGEEILSRNGGLS